MVKSKESASQVFFPSLTQVRAFAEAAKHQSISKASDELRRSQSTMTQAIQNLENQLNVPLLERKNTGSYLTAMGKILQHRVSAYFSRVDMALHDILENPAPTKILEISRRITKAQILALLAVDEHKSFAQASRYSHISITSLHRSARALEQQIGQKIFRNTASGSTTNENGERLAFQLRLAIREFEWAEEEMRSQGGILRGRLLVGALMLAGNYFISLELDNFVPKYPEIKVNLVNSPYGELLTKLRSGSIDFLVGLLKNPPPTDDVVEEILGFDPYVIAVGRQHPLVGQKNITMKDIRSSEWLVAQTDAHRRSVFEGVFKGGPLPRYNIETHSLPTIFVMLTTGHRMAILTRSELEMDTRLGNQLTMLNYAVKEPAAALGVTYRKNWEPTQLQQTFLDFLREQASERLI